MPLAVDALDCDSLVLDLDRLVFDPEVLALDLEFRMLTAVAPGLKEMVSESGSSEGECVGMA